MHVKIINSHTGERFRLTLDLRRAKFWWLTLPTLYPPPYPFPLINFPQIRMSGINSFYLHFSRRKNLLRQVTWVFCRTAKSPTKRCSQNIVYAANCTVWTVEFSHCSALHLSLGTPTAATVWTFFGRNTQTVSIKQHIKLPIAPHFDN